jgi:hypothetical protein
VQAQGVKGKKGAAAPGMPGMGGTPGMGGIPGMGGVPGMGGMGGPRGGMGPGMMPGAGGFGGKKIGPKKPQTKREAPDSIDNERLPPGYKVPQEPPEAFTTTNEWVVESPFAGEKEGSKKIERAQLAKYRIILEAGEFKDVEKDKEFVASIMRWKLSRLTHKDMRETAEDWREKIKKDLANNPRPITNPKTVRKFLLKVVADEAPKLFEYHAIARLNGAILLAELSEVNEAEAEGRNPAVPCTRGAAPLMEMVKDSAQLTSIRVWGVKGLVRLATLPEVNSQIRGQIVDTLVAQLNASGKEHQWYQMRLVEGLGKISVIHNQDKRPFVPQALARVMTDIERPWLVRSEAAQSLGRLPYDSNIDLGLLAYEMARLAQQMTEAFNKQPKLSIWKLCFMKVYGGFKSLEDDEGAKVKRGLLAQVETRPALSTYRKTVQESFELVLPLVVKVVGDDKETEVSLANLKKWLDLNAPKNFQIHPEEEPIVSKPGTATHLRAIEPAPPLAQQAR